MSDRFVSADMAAAMTGRTVRTIRRWAAQGKLKTERTSDGHVRYLSADLERLADKTDIDRTPVRLEETDAHALLREAQAQAVTLAHRVGELEGENRVLREELARERARIAEIEQSPTRADTVSGHVSAPPEQSARPWWRRLFGKV